MNDCLITIPVYNEQAHILSLLDDINKTVPDVPILVVNDGSSDNTRDVLSGANVKMINHERNKGKGEALKSAARYARDHGYQWIITLDGDGQHPPDYLPDFLAVIKQDHADLVLGNRQSRTESMPWHRRFSNGTTSVMVSLVCGQRIHDSQCGYRAIRLAQFPIDAHHEPGFMFESEIILRMGRTGARFTEIPVSTNYNGEASSIHLVYDTLRFVRLIFKSFFW